MIIRLGSQSASASVATPWDPSSPVGRTTYAIINVHSAVDTKASPADVESPPYHPGNKNCEQTQSESRVIVTLWTATDASDITSKSQVPKGSYPSSSPHPFSSMHAHWKTNSNSNLSKSFRSRWTSSLSFPSWSSAQILSVANVLDEPTQATFTHILIALSSNSFKPKHSSTQVLDSSHALALLRIENLGIAKVAKLKLQEELPSQAIILRGPTILTVTDNVVHSFCSNSIPSDGYTPRQQVVGTSATRPVIGSTEKDTVGLVLASSGENWNLTSVRASSSSVTSFHVSTFPNTRFPAPPVFIYGTCTPAAVVAVCDNGAAVTVDVRASSILNLAPPSSLQEFLDCTVFENTLYLASAKTPHQIFFVPLRTTKFSTKLDQNNPVSALPECRSLSGSKSNGRDTLPAPHGHFYAAWRGRMLMVNAATGVCCVESSENSPLTSTIGLKNPSVETMVQNLRERLDFGVSAYKETVLANTEKRRMLNHAAGLFTDVVRAPAVSRRTQVLDVRLQRIITRTDNRVSVSTLCNSDVDGTGADTNRDDTQMADLNVAHAQPEKDLDAHSSPVRLWVAGQSFDDASPAFLQVTRARCSLDPTETYVVVDIDAYILEPHGSSDNSLEMTDNHGFSLLLGMRIDRCVSSIFNMTVHKNVSKRQNLAHIRAAIPVADVITAGVPLNEVQIYIRVDGSDGRCQHLGQFSMRDLFSNAKSKDEALVPHVFEENVFVIAEGRNAHKLGLESPPLDKLTKEVFRQEGIVCLALTVTNGVELACAAARLKLAVDDEVSLRWTPKLHKSTLDPVNQALVELQQELQNFLQIAAPNDAVGYSARQVAATLARQQRVDQAFGRVAELCPTKSAL